MEFFPTKFGFIDLAGHFTFLSLRDGCFKRSASPTSKKTSREMNETDPQRLLP